VTQGSVKSSTAGIILYVLRLGARVDSALTFLIQVDLNPRKSKPITPNLNP